MRARLEWEDLTDLIRWINENVSNLHLPTDDRSMLVAGCFDVALEHQAAIAMLHKCELPGSMLALLRVLAEAVVRGLWLCHCATDAQIAKFKNGKLDIKFGQMVAEFEAQAGTPSGVLSSFKKAAYVALNGFTHTGMEQIHRRHAPGRVEANYPDHELAQCLDVAGVFGMLAAGQIAGMSGVPCLVDIFGDRMRAYSEKRRPASPPR